MGSGAEEHSNNGEHKKHQKPSDKKHLGDEHRLGPLTGLALHLGQLPAAQVGGPGGQRLPDLGAVVGDQAERGGQVAQLVDADLVAERPERLPGGLAAEPGVGQGVAQPGDMDQPPPITLAAISASGTPRPPARFIETRSRKAPTACRKSCRR